MKGNIPWNKGKKCPYVSILLKGVKKSKSSIEKMRATLKRKYRSGEIKHSRGTLGRKHTKEWKENMSKIMKEQYKNKGKSKQKGWKHTKESLKKIKEARKKQILPIKDTKIEVKIQNFLKQLGIEFFTHQYMKEIEHSYQCDILIPSMNLVIECDGDHWHKYPIGKDIDHIRTKELIYKGFKVLRLWECEIKVMDINKFNKRLNHA